MKVVHVVGGSLSGGAARGAYWLHRALLKNGIESKILLNHHDNLDDETVICLKGKNNKLSSIKYKTEKFLFETFYKPKSMFSLSVLPGKISNHPELKDADIVNLHWINGGFISIFDLRNIGKPIVWTVRDMWPLTGGCHYFLDCTKYKIGCGGCPQLESKKKKDITYYLSAKKQEIFKQLNLTAVGISSWTTEQILVSKIFQGKSATTIPNVVDSELFQALDKKSSKVMLGLKDKKTILFGAQNPRSFYKGMDALKEVLRKLDSVEYQVISFGIPISDYLDLSDIELKEFGFISDNNTLNLLYSASDVFICPSKCETFGKTIAEAMLCGTPSVAFDYSGPKDIIDHKINGYLAKPYCSLDFYYGVEWVLNSTDKESLSKKAIEKVKVSFNADFVAKKYIELYENSI